MTTYSQLIDSMVAETKRPDMLVEIESYLAQTIRECQMDPESNAAVLLRENYQEAQVVAAAATGFSWSIPRPGLFQAMDKVRYDNVWVDGRQQYARQLMPGPRMADSDYVYQYSAGTVVFKGYGGLNAVISLSWYEYTPGHKYYASAAAPATWDDESGWTYHEDYDVDDATRATARRLVSDWLTLRWATVLREGLRAKVYKRLSDDNRARLCYSLYQSLRRGLITSEQAITGPY